MKTRFHTGALAALVALSVLVPRYGSAQENFLVSYDDVAGNPITGGPTPLFVTVDHFGGIGLGARFWVLGIVATNARVLSIAIEGTDAEAFLSPNESGGVGIPDWVVQSAFPTNREGIAYNVFLDALFDLYALPEDSVQTVGKLVILPDRGDPALPVILGFSDELSGIPFAPSFFQRVGNDVQAYVPRLGGIRRRPNNLVPNAEFDAGVSGWTAVGLTAGASAVDVDSFPDGGSALLQLLIGDVSGSLVSGCFPVTADRLYTTGGSLQVISGDGSAGIDVEWHADGTCTSLLSTSGRADPPAGLEWQDAMQELTAPVGAMSAQVRCSADTTTPRDSFAVECDSVFVPEPGALPSALAALAVLAGLARRRNA